MERLGEGKITPAPAKITPFNKPPSMIRGGHLVVPTVERVPLALKLAKSLIRRQVRGGNRLLKLFECLGMLNKVVEYQLGHMVTFGVPLFRSDTCWDRRDVEEYERQLLDSFCLQLEQLSDVVLFDCGADIGTFSAVACSKTSRLGRIIAFEPNRDVSPFLRHNLSQMRIPADAIVKAVSCFEGTGRLEFPDYDNSDHSRFLVPGDGPLEVVTIDSVGVRNVDVAIKIDVEGGELEVLQGSARTISSARNCVVCWEVHPVVAKRTKRDPVECLRFLQSLRPFSFVVAETGESPSASSPLIRDGQQSVVNVLAWT